MTRSDATRHLVSLTVAVLCLLVTPQLAQAAFTARQAPTLAVSTARLVAPTSVTGTFTCARSGNNESITVNVTDFTDTGPGGASYVYRLSQGTQLFATTTRTTRTASLSAARSNDGSATTWTLAINATLSSWTGPAASRSLVCPTSKNFTGPI